VAEVRRINLDLAAIAERVAGQADAVVRNARRTMRSVGAQASGRTRGPTSRRARPTSWSASTTTWMGLGNGLGGAD
jgi:hypothetical protein